MRRLAVISIFLTALVALCAGDTNLYCIVCGKGPLTGQVWMSKWGPVCDDCYHLKDHCSICGLPIKDGDGHVQTGDGRLICRFDKTNAILTQAQAEEVFQEARDAVVDIYGQQFALKYPNVKVNLFDVDYWSEKNGANGLHKYGFASTRKTADGACTHEVVMLSGRLRNEMLSVAAHEYTHLWINENCPANHVIDPDTVEAICELTAYKLMQKENLPEMMQRILENPYTNGKIKTLVEVEREGGTDYVLHWVKNSKDATFDDDGNVTPISSSPPTLVTYAPRVLPQGLKFSGVIEIGKPQAVINDVPLAVGDEQIIKLRDKSVKVRCKEISDKNVTIILNGSTPLTLDKGEEKLVP
jgi:hypothetical protein